MMCKIKTIENWCKQPSKKQLIQQSEEYTERIEELQNCCEEYKNQLKRKEKFIEEMFSLKIKPLEERVKSLENWRNEEMNKRLVKQDQTDKDIMPESIRSGDVSVEQVASRYQEEIAKLQQALKSCIYARQQFDGYREFTEGKLRYTVEQVLYNLNQAVAACVNKETL